MPYYTFTTVQRVRYRLEGGQLGAPEIRVSSNTVFRHSGGTISSSPILTLAGGAWESAPGEHEFGSLKLVASTRDSTLLLPNSSAAMRFAHVPPFSFYWDAWARLVIHNWRGSLAGGGAHRVLFGTNASGLTPSQLAKIRFQNPAGLSPGEYPATILDTGEVVPLPPDGGLRPAGSAAIAYQQIEGRLRLAWPTGFTLQTATNLAGPFEDMNTNSPYAVDPTAEPRRFFRFRH